jgi:DNA repair protein RadC
VGSDSRAVGHLGAVREAMLHALRSQALAGPVLSDSDALLDYLSLEMAHLPSERLRVLFLNARNQLLADETLSYGSISKTPLYPREIIRRCLELGATGLILVHNHPSGDPRPSQSDIDATAELAAVALPLDVSVHDHLIVSRTGWTSFLALGLL